MKNNTLIYELDLTWKELSSLQNIQNSSILILLEILRLMWCANDESRETGPRIGTMNFLFDSDGHLHFDFWTRFTFTAEQQAEIKKILQEEQERQTSLWLKYFNSLGQVNEVKILSGEEK